MTGSVAGWCREEELPATAAGAQRYLGSGLIKGVGPVMAKRTVAHFGMDIMHVIEAEALPARPTAMITTGFLPIETRLARCELRGDPREVEHQYWSVTAPVQE